MSAAVVMQRLKDVFQRAGIQYMVTGSFASSHHGAPRSTQDIDLVIEASHAQLQSLIALLPTPDYYISPIAVEEAVRTEGQFNIIDMESGWKIDVIMRKSRPFSREEFHRRGVMDLGGVEVAVATAEDTVIAKLEWAKLGESQRQMEDIAALLRIRWDELDREYVLNWVRQLQLDQQWTEACNVAGVATDS